MGMPGVGKGTQATRLKDRLGAIHVSTGEILREAVQNDSPLGRKVKDYLDSGQLVPDEVIGDVMGARLGRADAGEGFILDGFPRTLEQVKILDRVLQRLGVTLDRAFLLVAPVDEIVKRLSGRRVCPGCAAVYHVDHQPPKSAGVCDSCGSALVQRPDDMEEVVRQRLDVYIKQTLPIADAYRERGLLHEVDATGSPDRVFDRLEQRLNGS